MWEILAENEKFWITMNENDSRMTLHFKVSTSSIDEDYWLELSYSEWRNLIGVARDTGRFSEERAGVGINEGMIAAEWLSQDCVQLSVGKHFSRYFTSEAWDKFSLLLGQAAKQVLSTDDG